MATVSQIIQGLDCVFKPPAFTRVSSYVFDPFLNSLVGLDDAQQLKR